MITDLKNAMNGTNPQDIITKTETLSKAMYEVSAKIYQQTQGTAEQSQQEQKNDDQSNAGDNIYDADFEVTDEDKKD